MEQNQIIPVIDKVFSITDTKDALTYLKQGKHFGKVVIEIE